MARTALDPYLDRGLKRLRQALAERGGFGPAEDALVGAVERLGFPGLLVLLAAGEQAKGPVGPELVARAARMLAAGPPSPLAGAGRTFVERTLEAVFVHGVPPQRVVGDPGPRRAFLVDAVCELAAQGHRNVMPQEAERAVRVLETGVFLGDLAGTAAACAHALPHVDLEVVSEARTWASPERPGLLLAAARDARYRPGEALRIVRALAEGRLPDPPRPLLVHGFRQVLAKATLPATRETLRRLLSPECEPVRLVLVLYGRANGIPVEPTDLDAMSDAVLRPAEPKLGDALVRALGRLERSLERDALIRALRRMAR